MTELSPVCHMTPAENNKHGSVGCILPNLRCKVRYYVNIADSMNYFNLYPLTRTQLPFEHDDTAASLLDSGSRGLGSSTSWFVSFCSWARRRQGI